MLTLIYEDVNLSTGIVYYVYRLSSSKTKHYVYESREGIEKRIAEFDSREAAMSFVWRKCKTD